MIAVVLSFFAAVKGGDIAARAILVGMIFAAVVAGIGWQIHRIYTAGGDARQATIKQSNDAARDAADAAQLPVTKCPAGKWNRERSRCEP